MNTPSENYEHILGNSRTIFSMVAPIFSGVIIMLFGDAVNPIFASLG